MRFFAGKTRGKSGANSRIRTDDLLITNELLYQLSYVGLKNVQPDKAANLSNHGVKSSGAARCE